MGRKPPWFKCGRSYDLSLSPDGRLLVNIDYVVNIWDVASRTKIGRFHDVKHPSHLAISHNGQLLAVKTTSGGFALYDLRSPSLIWAFSPGLCEGANPRFSPDDRFLVDADWDGNIRLIEVDSQRVTWQVRYANCMVTQIDHIPGTNQYLFLVVPKYGWSELDRPGWDGTDVLIEWQYPFADHTPVEHVTGKRTTDAARYSPDTALIATVNSFPGEVLILDRNRTTVLQSVPLHRGKELAWSADGRHLGVVGDQRIHFLSTEDLTTITEVSLEYACQVDFPPGSDTVLIGSWRSGYLMPTSVALSLQNLK